MFKAVFSVYVRICGEKKDETCRTHAKKCLHSIRLEIHADYVTFLFEKDFCKKNAENTLLFVYRR